MEVPIPPIRPPISGRLFSNFWATTRETTARVFDLGCGNGAFAAELADRGYDVTGVDPSRDGIAQARETHPELDAHVGSAYDDLQSEYGTFDIVVSLEVVEHVYYPRKYAACVYDLLERGGGSSHYAVPRVLEKSGPCAYGNDG